MATVERITHRALIRRAHERLNQIEEMHDAVQLHNLGKSQRDIADLLLTTQPRVGRLVRAAGPSGTPQPQKNSSCGPPSKPPPATT